MPLTMVRPSAILPRRTGPLSALAGLRVIAIADVQNLAQSARNLGYHFSWGTARRLLRAATHQVELHAIFASDEGDMQRHDSFCRKGWMPHNRFVRWIPDANRIPQRESNADFSIAFWLGRLSNSSADCVVLGTGDGSLGEELAMNLSALPKPIQVATLSVPGSLSQRLRVGNCIAPILANIEVGLDCLHPF